MQASACRWCPATSSCHVFGSLLDSCSIPVNTLGQCWESTYVYQIGDFFGGRPGDVAAWLEQTLAVYQIPTLPLPTYAAGATGLFDLAAGAPLASASEGSPASGVLLGVTSDWGTGTGVAAAVAALVTQTAPALTFHLGDVYYVGTADQFQTNVLGQGSGALQGVAFPKGSHTTFLLNGNHEMLSGGAGLFQTGFSYTGQQATYGVWQSDHWRFVALDTAYEGYALADGERQLDVQTLNVQETNAPQPQAVIDWLTNVVKLGDPSDTRGIVLFSHHQPISLFENEAYLGTAKQLAAILPPGKSVVWLFGHEHGLGIFELVQVQGANFSVYPRLIGNGGFPDTPPSSVSPDAIGWDARVFQTVSQDDFGTTQIGFNGFVKMQVTGAQLDIAYVTTQCVAAGCDAGLSFTDGTLMAGEQFTVDLASGALTQRWVDVGPSSGGGLTWAGGGAPSTGPRLTATPPHAVSPADVTPSLARGGLSALLHGTD